ncbi:MAG: efflux RND transporter periplasmic adaptor subunit, partial [Gemmatimonadales bacterium]|nr:efflux RND transporter periplasmic adaptor subunit [Gemmatimonadales bacterium]
MTAVLAALLSACKEEPPPPVYQSLPVERRDIVVTAQATGSVQPDTVVEVKSKASGEIQDLRVETGQVVKRGELMVLVDPRNPRNTLAQAAADLEVAQARLANATAQRRRADELFKSQSITEQEHEQAVLDFANARAEEVRARVAVDNAKDQLDDTNVRAPISGTIIEKSVERGQVISSPTRDVGGGTVLLKMADLNLVQVRTLVDETDIGKIEPGQSATVTVD